MSQCGPNCPCGKYQPPKPQEAEKPRGCTVVTKGGEQFELDLSATRLKHMRREKKMLTLQNDKGEKFLLDCSKIKTIHSLPHP